MRRQDGAELGFGDKWFNNVDHATLLSLAARSVTVKILYRLRLLQVVFLQFRRKTRDRDDPETPVLVTDAGPQEAKTCA